MTMRMIMITMMMIVMMMMTNGLYMMLNSTMMTIFLREQEGLARLLLVSEDKVGH